MVCIFDEDVPAICSDCDKNPQTCGCNIEDCIDAYIEGLADGSGDAHD